MTDLGGYAGILGLYVVLQCAWTLLIRTFPDFIGSALLKRVERRNATELEKLRDEHNRQIEGLKARLAHLGDRGFRANEREFQAIEAAWGYFVDAYAATMCCAIAPSQHPFFDNLSDAEAKQYLDASGLLERQREEVMSASPKDRRAAAIRSTEINQINEAGRAIYNVRNLIGKQAIFIPDDLLVSFEAMMQKLAAAQIQRSIEPHYGAHGLKDADSLLTNGEKERKSLLAAVRERIFRHEK